MAGRFVEQNAPQAGAMLGAALETYVPMGGIAVNVGRFLGAIAGKAIRPMVEQGTRSVVRYVMKKARQALGALAETLSTTLKAKLESVFG